MKINPLVSIIIPTYNRAHLISETLDSILSQTYVNWECIIIDDGSTDNTEKVVESYLEKDNRFQFYKRPLDRLKGANACRNYGFSISNGDVINWVDSDDVFVENHIEKHVNNFINNPLIEASITQANTFRNTINNVVNKWSNITPENDIIYEMIIGKVLWPICTAVWKRKIVPNNPFNETLSSSQEWVFHLNQNIKGIKFKTLEDVTFLVREHDERTGKDQSKKKSFSIFESRKLIFLNLLKTNKLDLKKEQGLLKMMFLSIRFSIQYKYYKLLQTNVCYLLKNIFKFKCKLKILKVIFISVPVYFTFRKGEKLFK